MALVIAQLDIVLYVPKHKVTNETDNRQRLLTRLCRDEGIAIDDDVTNEGWRPFGTVKFVVNRRTPTFDDFTLLQVWKSGKSSILISPMSKKSTILHIKSNFTSVRF